MPKSKSPASRAARRTIREYLRAALVANDPREPKEIRDRFTARVEALEPKFVKAIAA